MANVKNSHRFSANYKKHAVDSTLAANQKLTDFFGKLLVFGCKRTSLRKSIKRLENLESGVMLGSRPSTASGIDMGGP